MNDIYLIKNNNELSKFIRLIENNSAVGIDTEFMRRSTYWPILSLIQISDGNITALIDMISQILILISFMIYLKIHH